MPNEVGHAEGMAEGADGELAASGPCNSNQERRRGWSARTFDISEENWQSMGCDNAKIRYACRCAAKEIGAWMEVPLTITSPCLGPLRCLTGKVVVASCSIEWSNYCSASSKCFGCRGYGVCGNEAMRKPVRLILWERERAPTLDIGSEQDPAAVADFRQAVRWSPEERRRRSNRESEKGYGESKSFGFGDSWDDKWLRVASLSLDCLQEPSLEVTMRP